MNKENASKLWKIIQEAGDYLKGQLRDHPNHPKGRNPYAHVAICLKSKFQKSYKDIENENLSYKILLTPNKPQTFLGGCLNVLSVFLDYIEFLKTNPS